MKNEIVLKAPKREVLTGVVRLTPEAERILQKLSEDTGLALRFIASEMIIQGSEFVRIEEGK